MLAEYAARSGIELDYYRQREQRVRVLIAKKISEGENTITLCQEVGRQRSIDQ